MPRAARLNSATAQAWRSCRPRGSGLRPGSRARDASWDGRRSAPAPGRTALARKEASTVGVAAGRHAPRTVGAGSQLARRAGLEELDGVAGGVVDEDLLAA